MFNYELRMGNLLLTCYVLPPTLIIATFLILN